MSYRLFYAERSAAMGVRVLLEELAQPYELIETDISPNSPRSPALLALNPNGWIPVLIWEKGAVYECGAIVTFLCDRHSHAGLAPSVEDAERGKFLQWLFFFSSSLQNAYQMTYYPERFCQGEEDQGSVKQRSLTRLRELWQVVDEAIGDQQWLLGSQFTAVDIYLFMLTTWLRDEHGHPRIQEFSNVNRIAAAVMERPSVRMVYSFS
ncbi:MAG TPA: glutathione S-transferase family protein [Gammaproteobacteria bacterium]|nr:glutathione S-transferase family protein [Gammaproteobacteria bacterium]HIL19773.1 glutathione S-transferase family protein [Gammaproteobacteria bacterium]